MAIAKTAGRNVAFKVAMMRDSIMEDQDELTIRKSECEELGLEANTKAVLEDVGHNAERFVYRQSRGQHAKLGTWPVHCRYVLCTAHTSRYVEVVCSGTSA